MDILKYKLRTNISDVVTFLDHDKSENEGSRTTTTTTTASHVITTTLPTLPMRPVTTQV